MGQFFFIYDTHSELKPVGRSSRTDVQNRDSCPSKWAFLWTGRKLVVN